MDYMRIRVDYLVPDNRCFIRGDKIIRWDGPGALPSEEELSAVDVATILSDRQAKKQEVEAELSTNILSGKTFADVDNYIDNQFASATTVSGVKSVIISVLKIFGKLILAIAKKQGLSK